ncbi:MAG: flagellar motor switch protein FliN [Gammaproteobacteria bacterium]
MSEQTEGKEMDTGDAAATPAQAAPDTADGAAQGSTDYERAAFQELGEEAGAARKGETSLDVILDIPVTLSMEIGRSKISIENLLQLARGSVVELDRMAGEPLDVLVNGTLVAHGEVVVVNDKFGVRLSDVVSPAERVNTLK